MAYRSILSIWDGKKSSLSSLRKAIELTSASNGHLHVICPAYIRVPSHDGFPYSELPTSLSMSEREDALEKVDALGAGAKKILEKEDVSYTVETAIMNRDQLASFMSNAVKYCDLTVLPQPFGRDRCTADEKITEGTLFSSDCPILIVPEKVPDNNLRVLIAWDGGQESLRAVRSAMPFLREAETVDALTISSKKPDTKAKDIASDLAIFLSRHRVKSNINVIPKKQPKISENIQTYAKDLDANLIVMGGYSHSPLREFFFGGPTRDMLNNCDVPILMAH
ncbi:universal stress protein [Amylibacter sp. SFDW26]|uniref:universal stress protein n=1 Tax=Amylibacter sp. SFDW26 TaxID=2652722 RepID=UPI0012624ACA|nr:universal stress protein [Amylibacter sp. SFDW26]KAB7614286.1 universal stress protein [Amylibacter sp. SFDW26]